MGSLSRRLEGVAKIGGTPATDDLGDAWLTGLAADDAIGARGAMTVGPAIMSRCVL